MKLIVDDKPVTRSELQMVTKADLKAELQNYPTKGDLNTALLLLKTEVKGEMEDLFTQFRSDMFTRFDQIMGELGQIREDNMFRDHDSKQLKATGSDHEKRITILETS